MLLYKAITQTAPRFGGWNRDTARFNSWGRANVDSYAVFKNMQRPDSLGRENRDALTWYIRYLQVKHTTLRFTSVQGIRNLAYYLLVFVRHGGVRHGCQRMADAAQESFGQPMYW